MSALPRLIIEEQVKASLREDLGHGHDSTSNALIPPDMNATLKMTCREEGVLSGIDFAAAAFRICEPSLKVEILTQDGKKVAKGTEVLKVSGNARAILSAERVALNYLSHLSGIATKTAHLANLIKHTNASIACTRKTLPGLRTAQKYAVRCGGGKNHRFGLDDGILIKDNHIAIAGSVGNAIESARKNAGHMVKIEIEVDTLDQLKEAINHKIDAVLLDNMSAETLAEALKIVDGQCLTEASGGIDEKNIVSIAETGVDIISSGALTHSAQALDIGLDHQF